jgi:hydrogenase maturation protein HypF
MAREPHTPAGALAVGAHARAGHGGARIGRRVHVSGIVQGVGLRPFLYSLATSLGLAGSARNDSDGVVVDVEGPRRDVAAFLDRLVREAPPLAVIERVRAVPQPVTGAQRFAIADSRSAGERSALIAPDIATCADCLGELFDRHDRRYLYPFINCSNCGPRFSIVRAVPYDRRFTTMAEFAMCGACAREYRDPRDRRFHAQPISCPACGPRLRLADRHGTARGGEPIGGAVALLRGGRVVAVKGLGGYHLAAAAADQAAVAALRERKHREDRPFAVMVRDLSAARQIAAIDAGEAALLSSAARPIVLLRRRADARLAEAVAPGNRCVGILLAYTPLHHLLCHHLREPLVLTSGNLSDEPIAHTDADAFSRLSGIADGFLTHDRAIHTRTDDSVTRLFRGRALPIRRSRGCAPQPIALPEPVRRPILACGAELKNTFCLAKGSHAFLSHHIGDLENYPTLEAHRQGIALFQQLFDVAPQVVAHDLHPEYLSTKLALELPGVERLGVQHHHAHIAACLAEHGAAGPAIGVAFDGLGYGLDGTLWGGEFLFADLAGFERLAYFTPVPMPGGSAAIRQPWRMAAAYLDAAGEDTSGDLAVAARNAARWPQVLELARRRLHAPLTSSVGRLFDAVSAMLGVRDAIHYEGQAAVELEQRADPSHRDAYAVGWDGPLPYRLRGTDLVRAAAEDLRAGLATEIIAARVHNGLAQAVVAVCSALRDATGVSLVALSGGVFQNLLLLERTVDGLAARGFRVLTHAQVPANDGGISLGQTAVAAARDRGEAPRAAAATRSAPDRGA